MPQTLVQTAFLSCNVTKGKNQFVSISEKGSSNTFLAKTLIFTNYANCIIWDIARAFSGLFLRLPPCYCSLMSPLPRRNLLIHSLFEGHHPLYFFFIAILLSLLFKNFFTPLFMIKPALQQKFSCNPPLPHPRPSSNQIFATTLSSS